MKDLIRKILRESDDWDWIIDIISDNTVTKDNFYNGMRVKLKPDSEFSNQTKDGEVGTIYSSVLEDDAEGNDNYWVSVRWDESGSNVYRVGDIEFDLDFVVETIKESEDGLDWIRDVKYIPIELPLTEENIHQTLGFSFIFNEKWYTSGKFFNEYKDPRVNGRTTFEVVNIGNGDVLYMDRFGKKTSRTIEEFIHFVNINTWIFLDHDGNYIFNNGR